MYTCTCTHTQISTDVLQTQMQAYKHMQILYMHARNACNHILTIYIYTNIYIAVRLGAVGDYVLEGVPLNVDITILVVCYAHIHIYTYMYIYIYIYTYACIYMYMYLHITYIHIHTYMHTYTRIHVHIYMYKHI